MKPATEEKIKFGFWGMVSGAALAMIIGFNWGGWTTSRTNHKVNEAAILASQASICAAQFMNGPNHVMKIKEFQATDSYKRSDIIEKGGWDKMPGQETAVFGVASACVTRLESTVKAGT